MKLGKKIFAFLLLCSVASCAKDDTEQVDAAAAAGSFALYVGAPSVSESRVGYEDKDGAGVEVTWASGDTFSVYDGLGEYVCDFKYADVADLKKGKFIQVGETKLLSGKYTAVFPAVSGTSDPTLADRDANKLIFAAQSGNDSFDHLSQSPKMRAEFEINPLSLTQNEMSFDFVHETAMLCLKFELDEGQTPKSLTVRTGEDKDYSMEMQGMTAAAAGTPNAFQANILIDPIAAGGEQYIHYKLILNDDIRLDHSIKVETAYEATRRYSYTIEEFNGQIPVYNAAELKDIVTYSVGEYFLAKDIDLSSYNEGEWLPIGTHEERFSGVLNGNDKTISNLTIKAYGNDKGLFGSIYNCTISNLKIKNVSITNGGVDCGALAGVIRTSTLRNIEIDVVNITCENDSGGLCGYIYGSTVENITVKKPVINGVNGLLGGAIGFVKYRDYNTTNDKASIIRNVKVLEPIITSTEITTTYASTFGDKAGNNAHLGGLIGIAQGAIIENCVVDFASSTTAKIEAEHLSSTGVGGIVGTATTNSTIEACRTLSTSNTADQIKSTDATGGIVGAGKDSPIINCYNEANVTTSRYAVGGIAGRCYGTAMDIIACYNTGTINSKNENAGGIAGYIDENTMLIACYNKGEVSAQINDAGGLVGYIKGSTNVHADVKMFACYNDAEIVRGSGSGIGYGGVMGDFQGNTKSNFTEVYWVDYTGDAATNGIGREDRNPSAYTEAPVTQTVLNRQYTIEQMNAEVRAAGVSGVQFKAGATTPELEILGEIVY